MHNYMWSNPLVLIAVSRLPSHLELHAESPFCTYNSINRSLPHYCYELTFLHSHFSAGTFFALTLRKGFPPPTCPNRIVDILDAMAFLHLNLVMSPDHTATLFVMHSNVLNINLFSSQYQVSQPSEKNGKQMVIFRCAAEHQLMGGQNTDK